MRSLTPLPSGYVRPRARIVPFAGSAAPLRFMAGGLIAAFEQVSHSARRVARDLAQRFQRRRMITELNGLSDHALKDIGLSRGTIRSAVMDVQRGIDPRSR